MLKKLLEKIRPAAAPAEDESGAIHMITRGNALEDAGRVQEACDLYREAVARAPSMPRAHLNLGLGLAAAGDSEGAERAYQAVLDLDAAHPFGCYNYASLQYRRGDLDQAESLVRRALSAKADFPEALLLLSNILDDRGQTEDAITAAREALRLSPDYTGGHYNLALLLEKARHPEAAMEALRRSMDLGGDGAPAHSLLARLYAQQGLMQDALHAIRTARTLDPQFEPELGASRELFYMNFSEEVAPEEMFRQHQAYGAALEAAAVPVAHHAPPGASEAGRRLRIGWISGDLRAHPVALFLLPVFEHRDPSASETFVYSTGDRRDHITERLKGSVDHWFEVRSLDDEELARRIHADRIDILVDLSGHSGALRLGVFARKPAPVQVSWLGYLNTTGLTRMDYRLSDARADPPALAAALHTEELVYLPNSQWCYRPFLSVPAAHELPADANGFITFGSFNQASKVTAPMALRWAQIMARVPRSRLLVADAPSAPAQEAFLQTLREAGVEPERVEFVARTDVEAYYGLFARADIALDTFPYSGGTTTFDAVAHGVPVVTAPGPTSFSRSASSILAPLGLEDWVAPGIDDYVGVAVRHACAVDALRQLRQSLPHALAASPFMDEARFAADLEATWRRVWSRFCEGQ